MGRGAYSSVFRLYMVIHETPQSKINQLNFKLFVNDNVLCLDVPMANILLVAIKYCTGQLNESIDPNNGT